MARHNLAPTRPRLLTSGAILVLLLLGAVLPYVRLTYVDAASVTLTATPRLFRAASLLGGVDPVYLPGYAPGARSAYDLALNFAAAGPGLQQIGTVLGIATCWALITEEINRFWWWFLHLSGYPLVLAPVALGIGVHLLHGVAVPVATGPAWAPGFLAGVLVLVSTWQARGRIDTYAAF